MFRTKLLIPFICITLWEGCSSIDITNSKWADEPVTIDGVNGDWKDKNFVIKDENIMVGIQNDSEYLYLMLTTGDRNNQLQILGRGFTVWLDKNGGNDKNFGIKFPVGLFGSPMTFTQGDQDDNTDRMDQMFQRADANTTIQILGPGENDNQSVMLADAKGISIKMGRQNSVLVYEMKIALKKSSDDIYAIGIKNLNSQIGVGFETAEINRDNKEQRNQNGDQNPGNRGPGNRGHGNFGRGQNRGSMPEPLKYWVKVTLAVKGTNTK
jgi:hypothetical protein